MTVIPDKVTPEIGWRTWLLRDDLLRSPLHDDVWQPGEPFTARCDVPQQTHHMRWECLRIGTAASQDGYTAASVRTILEYGGRPPAYPPRTDPPAGCEWVLCQGEPVTHEPPERLCQCGIYALSRPSSDLPHFVHAVLMQAVVGSVALWGKVVPGTKGWRAQYAYPTALYVPKSMFRRGLFRDRSLASRLADAYSVPVHRLTGMSASGITYQERLA